MTKVYKYSYASRMSGAIIVEAKNKKEAVGKINEAMRENIKKDWEYEAKISDVFRYPAR